MAWLGESFDLFVSYASADNQGGSQGQVERLLDLLLQQHRRFSPHELRVFFDRHSVRSMEDWEHNVRSALRQSHVMLAVLSPAYFASAWCRLEWQAWVEHERARGRPATAAPIYVATAPELESRQPVEPFVADVRRRQHVDLRDLWSQGTAGFEGPEIGRRLARLEQDMVDRLTAAKRELTSPSTVPPHNERFVGRARELRQLREELALGRVGAIAAVHGLAGVGKSALAFEYAHVFASAR